MSNKTMTIKLNSVQVYSIKSFFYGYSFAFSEIIYWNYKLHHNWYSLKNFDFIISNEILG